MNRYVQLSHRSFLLLVYLALLVTRLKRNSSSLRAIAHVLRQPDYLEPKPTGRNALFAGSSANLSSGSIPSSRLHFMYSKNGTYLHLLEAAHTTRLRQFSNMSSFPTPAFHGCVGSPGLCNFSNVCFSNVDGMLLFETVPGLFNSRSPSDEVNFDRVAQVTMPRRPRIVPHSVYSKLTNVFFAKKMFVMNCWRQRVNKTNPAHFAMGYGKLFVLASGHYLPHHRPKAFDLLLYHQCNVPSWPWAQLVDRLILDYAIQAGIIASVNSWKEANTARMVLPSHHFPQGVIGRNDLIICADTVFQEPFTISRYFGSNAPHVVSKWQKFVDAKMNMETPSSPQIEDSRNQLKETTKACIDNLRVALWRRTEGSALRLLKNEDEIQSLVSEFTKQPISMISANSETSPEEQAKAFRSFDILITPHGSHLANMMFSTKESVFIEVSAVFYDGAPMMNGRAFAKQWIHSLGHVPYKNTNLEDKMGLCTERSSGNEPNSSCPKNLRYQFIQSDLIVNLTILRRDMRRSAEILCGSGSE